MDNTEDSFWAGLQLDGVPHRKFKLLYAGDFFIYYRPLDRGPKFLPYDKYLCLKLDSNSIFVFDCNIRVSLCNERIDNLDVIICTGTLKFDIAPEFGKEKPRFKRTY